MDAVQHHPRCSPDYPEKVQGEAPQALVEIPIDDGEVVLQCVDCGAYVIRKEESNDKRVRLLQATPND